MADAAELSRAVTRPTVFSANLLVLISVVLAASVGAVVQTLHLGAGLIGTELLCVLLPTLAFAPARTPMAASLRLNRVGPRTIGLDYGTDYGTA